MNTFNLLIFSLVFLNSIITIGQIPEEQPLYPNGIENNPIIHGQKENYGDSLVKPESLSHENRVFSYISNPTYLIYPASDSNNKHIAVIIFPGGGLVNNWLDKEGTDLAIWLSAKGINCMVLKYRTKPKDENGKYILPMDEYTEAVILA